MKNVVNIINFIRAIEPRPNRNIDMQLPMREQIRLMKENCLTGTFLLQYDAMISPDFASLIDEAAEFCEIGLWLEVVQPQVEAVGLEWRGRYPWDWHNDVGFLIGYEPHERRLLIDEAMERFKERFGRYPDSVGSWHIDAVSLKYLEDKYGIVASCNCRDQVGTDGYTMQGGYYNQAYYPSVNNMFCPASTQEKQINIPVFRMLGSDPFLAYDYGVFDYGFRSVPSLEAVHLGGREDWVEWFTDTLFGEPNGLCFQYTQAGQENSFGWQRMGKGIEYQFPYIAKLKAEGKIEVMTLGESGRWFRKNYKTTPAAALRTMSAWNRPHISSVWYYSRSYRINIVVDSGVARIRDMYLFDDEYPEHYLSKRCSSTACEFRNLPIMDGSLYSNAEDNVVAGIYFCVGGKNVVWKDTKYSEISERTAVLTLHSDVGDATVSFDECGFEIFTDVDGLALVPQYDTDRVLGRSFEENKFTNNNNRQLALSFIEAAEVRGSRINFRINRFDYGIEILEGKVDRDMTVSADNGRIRVGIAKKE
ncbi:MAG: hypothetical protein E7642_01110 [Ruminococcaceae bacterium]|nr:hypothetical protein [Oscillospiraceae bacterium]